MKTSAYLLFQETICLDFAISLFQIPAKLNQKNKYKGKNLEQILHLGKNDSKLSKVTVQKYMIRVAQFFNYSYDSGYIGKSITNNINVKIEIDSTDRKVLPYSKEEAQTIFKIVLKILKMPIDLQANE